MNSGFGGFGQQNNNTGFGAPQQPQTGFGFGQNQQPAQPAQPQTNTFGGFGAQPQNTFGQPSQPAATGAFGQPAGNTGTSLFGSKPATGLGSGFGANNTTAPGTGTGLFGSNANTGTSGFGNTGGGLFGNNNNNNTTGGGLFGNTANNNTANTTGGGLFGSTNNNTAGNTSGGFGNTGGSSLFGGNNNNTSTTGGGLSGNNNNTNQTSTSGGGLFGNTNTNNAATNTNTGGGLFGNNNNTNANTGGGLFGNSQPSGGGLFGNTQNQNQNQTPTQPQQSGGLFGNNAPKPGGLFGGTQPQPSGGGGLFGSANQQPSGGLFNKPAGTTGGGLFGNTNNTTNTNTGGGLFGNANTNTNTNTGGGLFGNNNANTNGGGLFGKPAATGQQPQSGSLFTSLGQQQPQQQLIARIDQPSFVLPESAPPQKLYSSLSLPSKRTSSDEPKFPFAKSKSEIAAKNKRGDSNSSLKPGLPPTSSASVIRPLVDRTVNLNTVANNTQTEPRQWLNSYEQFLRDRPTTLVIKHNNELPNGLPDVEIPPSVLPAVFPSSLDGPYNQNNHQNIQIGSGSGSVDYVTEPGVNDGNTSQLAGDISLFRRTADNMTIVKVNKRAIDEGYYIKPDFKELASMDKDQLSSLPNLIIGRKGFGKIEYSGPIDLTGIANLGDILGGLVIFNTGTVCVYPDLDNKKPVGTELNLPATITLENIWARDPATRKKITDPEDPRTTTLVENLKTMCQEKGADFITYTHGLWIMKVPHFSVWGITPDQMFIDLPVKPQQPESFLNSHGFPLTNNDHQQDRGLAQEVEIDVDYPNNENGIVYDQTQVVVPEEEGSEIDIDEEYEESTPNNWIDQLKVASKGVLNADLDALENASVDNIDLENILVTEADREAIKSKINEHDESPISSNETETYTISDLRSVQFRNLVRYVDVSSRIGNDLPLLHTKLKFSDLAATHKTPLWEMFSIIFSKDEHKEYRFSQWLAKQARKHISSVNQNDLYEGIWQLLSVNNVDEAVEKADKSGEMHLALMISLMGSNNQAAVESAKKQVDDWKSSGEFSKIPIGLRNIWEISAGDVSSCESWSWESILGALIWYAGLGIRDALKIFQTEFPNKLNGQELIGLQFYANETSLSSFLSCLNLPDAFFFLQGYQQSKSQLNGIPSDELVVYDTVCSKLSAILESFGDQFSALYAALHIQNNASASKLCTRILSKIPVSESIPLEFGLSEKFLNETRATQVELAGEYRSQADYLVLAGKYDAAHDVLVSNIAPQALISNTLESQNDILSILEAEKASIPTWDVGGGLYMAYLRCLAKGLNTGDISYMYRGCCGAETPTLLSQYSVSKIAFWLASNPKTWEVYDVCSIMQMKFTNSDRKTQSILQSSRIL